MTTWGIFKSNSVAEAYKKMKQEELKGNQHKLDKNNNGKLDKDDFDKLRNEDYEQVQERVKTTHEDPLVTVHDKDGLHTHANLSTANRIFTTNVKHTDVHKGPVKVKSGGSYGNVTFELSQHHAAAMKEETELEEATPTKQQVKQAIGIARDKRYAGGNMTGAVNAMDKLNKGLAQHPAVAKELKKQNEEVKPEVAKSFPASGVKKHTAPTGVNYMPKDKEKAKGQPAGSLRKEEVEQIDEISKKTLGSYVSKAAIDMTNRTADATKKRTLAGADYAHNISRGMNVKTADKHLKADYDEAKPDTKKAIKRMYGIDKAVSRLTKEEIELENLSVFSSKEIDMLINEVLKSSDDAGKWISDFINSDDPRFEGDSKEKRKQRALAAYYASQKESTEIIEDAEYIKEEAPLVDEEEEATTSSKKSAKDIKHDNMKDKQDDQMVMEPNSEGEQDFLDKHYVLVTDDPAADGFKTGTDKVKQSEQPKGKGAGGYDAKEKLGKQGVKEAKTATGGEAEEIDVSPDSEDDIEKDQGPVSAAKKTFVDFKSKMTKKD